MNLGVLDIICLVGYMGGIGLMGVLLAKRNVTTEDYNIKTLQDTSTMLTAVLGGGLFGLFMLGMLTTRGNGRAAACGIVGTLVFITWTLLAKNRLLPESLSAPFDLYYTSVVGNMVVFFVGYLIGLLFFPNKKKLSNLTIWTHEQTSLDEPVDPSN